MMRSSTRFGFTHERPIMRATLVIFAGILVVGVVTGRGLGQCIINETEKLLAFAGLAGDHFGLSVAISGNVAIVGAHDDDDNGLDSGSASIFLYSPKTMMWTEEALLLPSDGAAGDQFGFSVAISGDVAIVGAFGDNLNSGAAYVFVKPPGGWVNMTQTATLTASDGAADDLFGISVSISGDVAVVGALDGDGIVANSGSAYVFAKPPGGWVTGTETAKLIASDGAANDQFGTSVGISGDFAIVGARWHDHNGTDSGVAYVYRFDGTNWGQEKELLASDGAMGDEFGISVAISGEVAIVGAYFYNHFGRDSGSAYIYRLDVINTWIEEQTLLPSDGAANDWFGYSVATRGDLAIVGAPNVDDNGLESGAAYYYRFDDRSSNWDELPILLASDGAAQDSFGYSVDISGDFAIVGAIGDDDNGDLSGSAYIFDTTGKPTCSADISGPFGGVPDGCVDAFDLGAMLGAWCSAVNDPNPPSPPCENCTPANLAVADISGAANVSDGCIDAFDLAKLLAQWCSVAGGNPCGTCGP